jgi:hypothetical protein
MRLLKTRMAPLVCSPRTTDELAEGLPGHGSRSVPRSCPWVRRSMVHGHMSATIMTAWGPWRAWTSTFRHKVQSGPRCRAAPSVAAPILFLPPCARLRDTAALGRALAGLSIALLLRSVPKRTAFPRYGARRTASPLREEVERRAKADEAPWMGRLSCSHEAASACGLRGTTSPAPRAQSEQTGARR